MYSPRTYRHQPIHVKKSSPPSSSSGNSSNVVEKMIKSGASGTAMLCRNTESGDRSVKKQIKCKSQREVEQAKTEAAILEDLRSTNVIDFQSFEQPNRREVNIYMEYADGGDLGDEIDRRAKNKHHYSEQELLERFADCVKAISTMHAKGFVHRDIKPQNIFLQGNKAKVGDFGIARSCTKNGRVRTPVGTPLYLDPQRCEGRDYGQKADMWSLGCVLYEMAALEPAFTARSMGELKRKVLRGNIDYSRIPSMYSAEITDIIRKLLEVKEERRSSVGDLLRNPMVSATIHQRDLLKISQSSDSSTDTIQEESSSSSESEDTTHNNSNNNHNNNKDMISHKRHASSRPTPAQHPALAPPVQHALAPIQRIKTPEVVRQEVAERRIYGSARDRARSHSPSPYGRKHEDQYSRSDRRNGRSPLLRSNSPPVSRRSHSPNPKTMSPLGSRRSEYKQMKSNLNVDYSDYQRQHLTPESAKIQVGRSTSRALHNALGHMSDPRSRNKLLPNIGS